MCVCAGSGENRVIGDDDVFQRGGGVDPGSAEPVLSVVDDTFKSIATWRFVPASFDLRVRFRRNQLNNPFLQLTQARQEECLVWGGGTE